MLDFINSFIDSAVGVIGPVTEHLVQLLFVLFTSGAALGAVVVFIYACWILLSAGLRQEQRARCFIRLLETGLQQGCTVEETVESMARARIRDLGVGFHLVA